MSDSAFWNDEENSSVVVKQLKSLKFTVEPWDTAFKKYTELKELADILKEEDRELFEEFGKNTESLFSDIGRLEFKTFLNGEFDGNNAILSINAGAGGTESCDWVGMLLRMYLRWAESKACTVKTIDMLYGEEAGVKNVTIFVEGEYAYGYLKAERGVHRLVRISPLDSNKRRHTSFASVDVIPEIERDLDVKLDEKDLSVETFRSSGPGGQHMQKTDSAVRMTHMPTGIVVQSQNERSQYQNKQTCLRILRARIFDLEREKHEERIKQTGPDKKKIEWGSQIRSYVLHPYNMVKDHRTDHETGDANGVLDGKLDPFIEAYLKYKAQDA
jgi:peptide chain release factor 2